MILWIESQDAAVIALIVFAVCYAIAGTVLAGAAVLSRRRVASDLKAMTPAMLTPLSAITGLLIAFLAARVWSNVDRANTYVAQEASGISETILLANALPGDTRDAVLEGLRRHLRFIEAEDWPAMLAGRASFRRPPPGLADAMAALLAFVPKGAGQQIAQSRAIVAVEQALEARRNRVLLSRAVIAPAQWLVILALDALILVIIAMLHLGRRTTAAVSMFVFSTAVAACLVLLMINDRPFNAGGFVVEPAVLRQIGLE